jgi:NADPH:quinone reductase
MRAIQISRTGGPDVLESVDLPTPEPGPHEARVRHHAIGLNFIDVYQRTGLYPLPLPAIPGNEAAGVVEAIGPGVTTVKVGDRVAYASIPGAYAEASCVAADKLVHLPDGIDFELAAAAMLKGLTAEYLVRQMWPLKPGDWALVHAAAGGVGSILTQWLAHLQVRTVGTVGTPEKAELAKAHGCEAVILYDQADVAARVRELTDGEGVAIVYDSVGKTTFDASLKSLRPRGLLVSYGNASGPVPPVAPLLLSQNGSLYLTRPTLKDFVATPAALKTASDALLDVLQSGAVTVEIGQRFILDRVQEAHRALEARQTTGATIITL